MVKVQIACPIRASIREPIMLFIGTAGWSIERACKPLFPEQGTHLERYAHVLNAVEINSSFYRPHQPKTYARWSACVPDHFKFSVKLPKEITHKRRFIDCAEPLDRFLAEMRAGTLRRRTS